MRGYVSDRTGGQSKELRVTMKIQGVRHPPRYGSTTLSM